MGKNERIAILVDGSNFYHYTKELGLSGQLSFDYEAFARYLGRGRHVVSATYYVGKVREDGNPRGRELMANQQRLIARLGKAGWGVGFGHRPSYGLIKNSDIRTLLRREDVAQFLPDATFGKRTAA